MASSKKSAPRIVVIGAGSIGRRHAENLTRLGASVGMYDVATEYLTDLCREKGYEPVRDLDKAIKKEHYDAALVCTPNHLHITMARKTVDADLDLFVEKPLSHSYDGVEDLLWTVAKKELVAMAGFNLRFEPGLLHLKKTIDPKRVAFAQIDAGSHMPTWRPGTDYRKTYSANRSMGGGIILDDVHELDYACWLFGYPQTVLCSYGRFSSLEIDVEDTADFHLRYPDKLVTVHSDYLQKRYTRRCKICYRDGHAVEWTFGDRVVEYLDDRELLFSYKDRFSVNDLYVEEMRTFLDCIRKRRVPESDLTNAARILKIAISAKQDLGGSF
jgi:predicted dehydrogenase